MVKALQAGKLIVGAIAISVDPTGTAAVGLGIDGVLQIKEWFKPKSDLDKLSNELQSAFETALKEPFYDKPDGARTLLPQMLEQAFPSGTSIAICGLDADEILKSMRSNLTDSEHLRAEMVTAFETLFRPLLVTACNDPRLEIALRPALTRATSSAARAQSKVLDDQSLDLKAILEAVTAGKTDTSTEDLIKVAEKFGAENIVDRDAVLQFLTHKAEEYRALKAEVDTVNESMRQLANLKAAAQDAIDRVDLEEVEALLSMVQETELDEAAKTAELRANNALLRGNVDQAFHLLESAANSFGVIGTTAKAERKILRYSNTLRNHGLRYGGQGLSFSQAMIEPELTEDLENANPWLWGAGKNTLAISLTIQGPRTSGAEGGNLLSQAVTAYRDALKVYTQADHSVNWATIQNNLSNALQEQGNRTNVAVGADLLAHSVTAYRAALQVRTKKNHPVKWAETQSNLGNTLSCQGTLTEGIDGIDLLSKAIIAFRKALQVRTQKNHPLHWATTQSNLGNALSNQGSRVQGANGADLLAQSVTAYSSALQVRTKKNSPVHWADTQNNIAVAHKRKSEHDCCTSPKSELQHALAAIEAALTVYDPVHMSYNFETATQFREHILAKLDALP